MAAATYPVGAVRTLQSGTARTLLRVTGLVLVLVVAGAVLKHRLPRPADIVTALGAAHWGWLAVAVVAEAVSIGLFARQQRRLLAAFGVTMTRHRASALSYARSAIAISLPAGSALSAGFAFRQYRVSGATRSTAATVMILSGIASTVALVLLYATGLFAAALGPLVRLGERHPMVILGVGVGVLAVLGAAAEVAAHRSRCGAHCHRWHGLDVAAAVHRRWPRVGHAMHSVADAFASVKALPRRHRRAVLALAAGNWLADLGCLVAVAWAFEVTVGVGQLAAIYLGIQVVRQIPLTPGGIGVIEISLLSGLLSAGAVQVAAAGTVLIYRLLSCWLIIPIGFLAWARLRHLPLADPHVPAAPAPDNAAGTAAQPSPN